MYRDWVLGGLFFVASVFFFCFYVHLFLFGEAIVCMLWDVEVGIGMVFVFLPGRYAVSR